MPRLSTSAFWTLTKSRMATIGNERPYGWPVEGSIVAGPVVTTFGSLALRLTSVSEEKMKYLSVSSGLPGPMILSQ
jgi:hypothetical protein